MKLGEAAPSGGAVAAADDRSAPGGPAADGEAVDGIVAGSSDGRTVLCATFCAVVRIRAMKRAELRSVGSRQYSAGTAPRSSAVPRIPFDAPAGMTEGACRCAVPLRFTHAPPCEGCEPAMA
ncbi:hypothetical protein GCM10023329_03390 [Streptomyces sanyensis]|uniref:Uncharacterized protein n=1 Tax=Streptomyces sanyensis TaxID=568869 RepID=A0ABP8ZNM5_9ACTN